MAKRTKADEKRVQKMAENAASVFYLDGYEMTVDFSDTPDDDGSSAEVCCGHPYRSFRVTVYPTFFTETEAQQARIIMHEMAHVITYPLVRLVSEVQNGKMVNDRERHDAWEHVADWIMAVVTG